MTGQAVSPIRHSTRVLDILSVFSHELPEVTHDTLGDLVGIPGSTLFRLVRLVVEYGFISRNAVTGHYSLGLKALELGDVASQHLQIPELAQSVLDRLSGVNGCVNLRVLPRSR